MTLENKVACVGCGAIITERLALSSYSGLRYCSWHCAANRDVAATHYVVSLRVDSREVADEARKALDDVRARFGIGRAVAVVQHRDR